MTSTTISFLSLIPDDVLRCGVFSFCCLEELSLLDQAVTNHHLRAVFLNALSNARYAQQIDNFSEIMAKWLVSRKIFLMKISVSSISSTDLNLILPHCHVVTHLNLCSSSISREDLMVIAKHTQKLLHLNLSNCDLNGDIIETFLEQNSHIDDINLSDCGGDVDDSVLEVIGLIPVKLKCFDVSYCTRITDDGLTSAICSSFKSDCEDISNSPRPLLELAVAHCYQITDNSLLQICPHCINLIHINVGHCNITDTGIIAITENCAKLLHLILSNCLELSEGSLYAIASSCSHLKELDMFNCTNMVTDATAVALSNGCIELEVLNMFNCTDLSDRGLYKIARKCNSLRKLNISSCVLISDSGLEKLSSHCPHLYELDLSYCNKVTNVGIELLKTNCVHMTTLNLFKCKNIRNLDLVSLYKSFY